MWNTQSPQVILISLWREEKSDQRTLLGLSLPLSRANMRRQTHGRMGSRWWAPLHACFVSWKAENWMWIKTDPLSLSVFEFSFSGQESLQDRITPSLSAHAQSHGRTQACQAGGCVYGGLVGVGLHVKKCLSVFPNVSVSGLKMLYLAVCVSICVHVW